MIEIHVNLKWCYYRRSENYTLENYRCTNNHDYDNNIITAIQLPTTNPCGGSLSVVLSKEKLGMLQSKVVPSLLSILNVPLKGKKTLVIIILSNYQL
jgi:hypothetical protein